MSQQDTKFQKYVNFLPPIYKPGINPFVTALFKAIGNSDANIELQVIEAKNQLYQSTASGSFLDALGSNVGVARPSSINLADDKFRKLIPALSYRPKQIRKTMYEILDVFWGPLYSRANSNSNNNQPYNLGSPILLSGSLTFTNGNQLVTGVGTLFLSEVSSGDYIRLTTHTNQYLVRVAEIINDTQLLLNVAYSGGSTNSIMVGTGTKVVALNLSISIDGNDSKIIPIIPSFIEDTTAALASEIATALNYLNDPIVANSISTSIIQNSIDGTIKLNIATNTPGPTGSINILGGTASTILGFTSGEVLVTDLALQTLIYEINPRELIIKIPSTVPAVRRELQGSLHIRGGWSGEIVSIDNTLKTVTVNLDVTSVITDYFIGKTFSAQLDEFEIQGNTSGLTGVVFSFDPSVDLSVLSTTSGENGFCILDTKYRGSFVFGPSTTSYTATKLRGILNQQIDKGSIYNSINVQGADDVPDESGYLMFSMGKENMEQPVRYRGRPNNNTILVDPSYVFQKQHLAGEVINVLALPLKGTTPRVTGDDFAVYITGITEAVAVVESLLQGIAASGVKLTFVIDYPDYLWHPTDLIA